MRILILIITIFTLTVGVQLGHAESTFSGQASTNHFEFVVTDQALAQTPVWNEKDDQAPFAPGKALQLAKAQLKELVVDTSSWVLIAIILEKQNDHWYYLVSFQVPSTRAPMQHLEIPVLMNGIVVKPKVSHL